RLVLAHISESSPLEAIEITGIDSNIAHRQALASALRFNSELTARANRDALDATLAALADPAFGAGDEAISLKGYQVIRKLASGGMSEVYLAERVSDGDQVVLKVLDLQARQQADYLTRFIQEYALLSAIAHPNVIRIHDQGFTDAHAYIAMEYFSSGDLRARVGTPWLTQSRALHIIQDIAAALAAIHADDIVHCDIKPENIMLREDGSAALADFGIARKQHRRLPGAAQLGTEEDSVMIGTPYYLSPEQAAGEQATTHSDMYSLGVIMFEILAGQRPFNADSLTQLREKHRIAATPPLPPEHKRLQPIVDRLMQKRPSDRYDSALQLIEALGSLRP
ncbi:MAG: serine/threonine protein kinase, partial [Comamonadaceae bacterium]